MRASLFSFLVASGLASWVAATDVAAQTQLPRFVSSSDLLGVVRFAFLEIEDGVSGGCWTNAAAIRSRLRLMLEREAIGVLDEPPALYNPPTVNVFLNVFGYRQEYGGCAVAIQFQISRDANEVWQDESGQIIYRVSGSLSLVSRALILTGGQNIDERLERFVDEVANGFLADVISARRREITDAFYFDFPGFLEEPMTLVEFRRILAEFQQVQSSQ